MRKKGRFYQKIKGRCEEIWFNGSEKVRGNRKIMAWWYNNWKVRTRAYDQGFQKGTCIGSSNRYLRGNPEVRYWGLRKEKRARKASKTKGSSE